MAGVVGGFLYELLIPTVGYLRAASGAGLVAALGCAASYLVEEL